MVPDTAPVDHTGSCGNATSPPLDTAVPQPLAAGEAAGAEGISELEAFLGLRRSTWIVGLLLLLQSMQTLLRKMVCILQPLGALAALVLLLKEMVRKTETESESSSKAA